MRSLLAALCLAIPRKVYRLFSGPRCSSDLGGGVGGVGRVQCLNNLQKLRKER